MTTWTVSRSAVAAATIVLAAVAAVSDVRADQATWAVTADVAVGLAFALGGLLSYSARHGTILVATGGLWLTGSLVPLSQTGYRGLLVLAFATYPVGRLRAFPMVTRIALVVLAAVATLPIVSAAGAVVFGLVALLVATTARATHRASWPIVGATVVAAAQLVQAVATEWGAAATRTYALALYESVLIGVAVGAIVADRRRRSRLRSRLGSQVVDGVDVYARLGELLGAAVGDPTLRIEPASDGRAEPTPLLTPVADDGVVLAVIAHGSGALDDAPTARALTEAVRLVARHERLLAQQRRSAAELVAVRSRLLDAEERERARLGALIRRDVTSPVAAVADRLRGRATEPGAVAQTLDTVVTELDSAVSEAAMLVAGLPALPLGDGRIHEALAALAERSPLPVVLHLAPEATGDSGAEAAAYAVCAEALTNAIKHADARRLSIDLAVVGDDLVVTTTDDGRGGADPSGSGLSGLAERVAARGGSFQVASSDGRGTRSHAVIPRVSQPIRA